MKSLNLSIALASSMLVAACGGGGGDSAATPAPSTSAEGVYGGALSGSTSSAFNLLVLENGEFWSLYGVQTSTVFGVAGFAQGTGTSTNSSFSSSNAKDFGFAPALAGSLTATYNAIAKTITGTVTAGTGTVGFSGGPIAGSLYNYDTAASLTTIAGAWTTTSITGETVAINVAANGAYTAAGSSGCTFSGTVTPRASGKNVFNVSLTFGAAPCALSGQSGTGIAIAYPLTGGLTQLLIAATDSTRTYGAGVFGTR
jgi:hypothetical protein